uniref:methylated-DNA--[protein]-cysteine S-methyltransferase n=1 Tax=Nitratidesulfovibrio vulgaris (strain DSM 19637 / Miyazaki F) TaxID=883 RepID=B8DQ29_NITV9
MRGREGKGIFLLGGEQRKIRMEKRTRRAYVAVMDTPTRHIAADPVTAASGTTTAPGTALRPDDPRLALVRAACDTLRQRAEPVPLAELAEAAGLSPSHFQRVFTRLVGVSPRAYQQACREQRLRGALERGVPVAEAIYEAGFGSPSRVYEDAHGMLGMTPARYRKGAPGRQLAVAAAQTSLGWLVMAATEDGVCAIDIGDDREALLADLQRRFPGAELHTPSDAVRQWLGTVVAFVEHGGAHPALPLDVRGTAFQHAVWSALRELPPGTTLGYAQLAARIGRPSAVRAVAAACARNPVAVVVPCHRVLGRDGALTGYRWGVDRKAELLRREAARMPIG